MKIFLSGKMSGVPGFNFPAFYAAAAKLRAQGHFVQNPAERDVGLYGPEFSTGNLTGDPAQAVRDYGFSYRDAMADNLLWICEEADAIAVLPDWKTSRGAKAEVATAVAIGLEVIEL